MLVVKELLKFKPDLVQAQKDSTARKVTLEWLQAGEGIQQIPGGSSNLNQHLLPNIPPEAHEIERNRVGYYAFAFARIHWKGILIAAVVAACGLTSITGIFGTTGWEHG